MPWLLSAHSPVQSDFYPEWEDSGYACSAQASALELPGLGKPCWQARVGEKCWTLALKGHYTRSE